MLRKIFSTCVQNGSKLSVGRLLSSTTKSPKTLFQHFEQLPWRANAASVSMTASCRERDPLNAPASPDDEDFGSLSTDIASRTSFKKSSPSLRDWHHREADCMEEEEIQHRVTKKFGRSNTPYWYFLKCKKLIKKKRLQEALNLFSVDMLKGERLQPEEFNYSVLIGGCGRAGQLKKAFKLYNDMKKRGLQPSDATYTALFNACAEAPLKKAGLQQALKLEQELLRKNHPLSLITYHALLKTHAITNNLQACIHTLREMLQNGHVPTPDTFHFLLMGCFKDNENGFRLALQVWRHMLRLGINPSSRNYNLLLRTARDCGVGDSALAAKILLETDFDKQSENANVSKDCNKAVVYLDRLEQLLFLQADQHRDGKQDSPQAQEDDPNSLLPVRQTETIFSPTELVSDSTLPSLLEFFEGKRLPLVSLGSVDGPSARLALIGGVEGFLQKMTASGHAPDLKTLTLLADTVEPGPQSLQMLLSVAKKHRVKLDVGFFNSVIHRAAKDGNMDEARAVLQVMQERKVSVNVQTFGCLALACDRQKDGLQLLQDIQDAGLRANTIIFSTLIGRATRRLDYRYLKTLLTCMKDMGVFPNELIIRQLEFAGQYPPNYNQYKSRNNYLIHIDGFRGYYREWLKKMPVQSADEEEMQFKVEVSAPSTHRLPEGKINPSHDANRFITRHADEKRNVSAV